MGRAAKAEQNSCVSYSLQTGHAAHGTALVPDATCELIILLLVTLSHSLHAYTIFTRKCRLTVIQHAKLVDPALDCSPGSLGLLPGTADDRVVSSQHELSQQRWGDAALSAGCDGHGCFSIAEGEC